MASSDNFPTFLNPWPFRSTFQDPWISDPFSRESQSLTKALHTSLLPSDSHAFSSFLDLISSDSADPTPTVSGISAGAPPPDPDTAAAPKRQRTTTSTIPPTAGKGSKRKSRASKRNHTTFITADPANFRQMVQQVTGVRFGNSQIQIPAVVKPEPQRASARFAVCGGDGLPTLDTSAFLLNGHHQQSSGSGSEITHPGPLSFGPDLSLPNNGPIGSDFDTFSSFPTLESWKAVL
ncbi:calmodulin-binding protein 25-like [Benincasa hispida]|uniref:calmodulin-binding protein 25-like n=1 Tax=Benincasa hispida TaxID=102211 RepID=UPI0018FFFBFE|nr:calmodulin-binding protein 25-like [Benincasa hispida]